MTDPDPGRAERARSALQALNDALSRQIIGQAHLLERLLIGLLADGHLLVEGFPGLAKTRAVRSLADALEATFHRVQFTPDLLPADITGSDVLHRVGDVDEFRFMPGPVFGNVVLADEINRAPAKVQSALLEAMEERQVSVGSTTHRLPEVFLVMATQNPLEHEGTFPLPEAQLDRFLMHVRIDYPDRDAEIDVIRLVRGEEMANRDKAVSERGARVDQGTIMAARAAVSAVHVEDAIDQFIADLVRSTRDPGSLLEDYAQALEVGASPRASLALDRCARAKAWLEGRDYVTPADVRAVAHDVLRHRLVLSYQALGADVSPDAIIDRLLERVAAP